MTESREQIDVTVTKYRGDITLTPEEHDHDRSQRLKREDRAAWIDDLQRTSIFFVILFALITIGGEGVRPNETYLQATSRFNGWTFVHLSFISRPRSTYCEGYTCRN